LNRVKAEEVVRVGGVLITETTWIVIRQEMECVERNLNQEVT
jgi:hypothetical protein